MRLLSWLRPLFARLKHNPVRRASKRPTFRPRIETLEDRCVPAIFTVTNVNDNGGVNPAPFAGTGTLRQAILDANATAGADSIVFAIPDALKSPNGNWWTIQPPMSLPALTDTVLVDGWSQPGAGAGLAPRVVIDGTNAGPLNGLNVDGPGCTIRGLAIDGFIGSNVSRIGIFGVGTIIQGCYVGLDPSGNTALGNSAGITDYGLHTMIGGTNPGDGNVVSGNGSGIGNAGTDIIIRGNRIGTNAAGTAAVLTAAGTGINVVGSSALTPATVGGSGPGEGNLIS